MTNQRNEMGCTRRKVHDSMAPHIFWKKVIQCVCVRMCSSHVCRDPICVWNNGSCDSRVATKRGRHDLQYIQLANATLDTVSSFN